MRLKPIFAIIWLFVFGYIFVFQSVLLGQKTIATLGRKILLTAEKIRGYNLSLKEAMWYRKLAGGGVQCQLCPLNCVLDEGERGICGIRANIGGKLRLLTYGKPVVATVETIEKQPFFHYLPGVKVLVVATVGCNLRCKFCQNWTISQALPENEKPIDISPEDLVKRAKEEKCDAISFACTEPVVFYEYMQETAKLARAGGIRVLVKTALFINPQPAKDLAQYIDAVNIDIKSSSNTFYQKYCNGSLLPVLEATKIFKEKGVWIEISHLIIPGANDQPSQLDSILDWILKNLGASTPTHFVRFIPNYKLADLPPTPFETLEKAVKIAKSKGFQFAYVVVIPGNRYEDTYCPSCGALIVNRNGFQLIENYILDGKCKYCGAKIPGVFH